MGDTKFRRTGQRTAKGPYRSDERLRKRQEAQERLARWHDCGPETKLASLRGRRGESKRQVAKLEKLL